MTDTFVLSRRSLFRLSFFLFFLVISAALLFRSFTEGFGPAGAASFENIQIAQNYASLWYRDPLIQGSRMVLVLPYHLLLGSLLSFFGMKITLLFLPLLLVGGLLFFTILLFSRLEVSQRSTVLALLGFLLSPALIYAGTRFSPQLFVLFLIAFTLWLAMSANPLLRGFAYPVMLLIAWSGIIPLLLFLLMLRYALRFAGRSENQYRGFAFFLLLVSLFLLTLTVPDWAVLTLVPSLPAFFAKTITIFGGHPGISGFLLLLSSIGFFVSWYRRKRYVLLYGFLLFLFLVQAFSLFDVSIYLTLLLLPLAVMGFESLLNRRWQLLLVKRLTIVILFYGLLFSSVAYSKIAAQDKPTEDLLAALGWIRDNTPPEKTVFTSQENGFLVSAIAGRPVMIDDDYYRVTEGKKIQEDYRLILSSRNLKQTMSLLKDYDVGYILITSGMKEGETFSREDEGLLFVLTNPDHFRRVYSRNKDDLWEVIP
ncbi:MAG: hypothetical protein GXP63_04275 [DPANN group archaeon]|nr:hypothetical protein [DPANN group archaeon]